MFELDEIVHIPFKVLRTDKDKAHVVSTGLNPPLFLDVTPEQVLFLELAREEDSTDESKTE